MLSFEYLSSYISFFSFKKYQKHKNVKRTNMNLNQSSQLELDHRILNLYEKEREKLLKVKKIIQIL